MSIPKVLVVDDNEEITSLLSRYFIEYKDEFASISTNNPKDVINILEEQDDILLVISDFNFETEEINGLELLIQIKEKFPHIGFVMMTGYGTAELRESVLKHGAVHFLDKPFQIHELLEIILQTIKNATSHFTGQFEPTLKFVDIIQFLAITGGDARLLFKADSEEGFICFQGGDIVHAHCGDKVGTDAFFELSMWEEGNFVVSDLEDEMIPQTINQSWQKLLIDVAIREEKREEAAKESETTMVDSDEKEAMAMFGVPVSDDVVQDDPDKTTLVDPGIPVPPVLEIPEQDVNAIGFQDIENALDRCIDFYMQFAPTSQEGSPVNELRLRKLQPVLRRHLIFHFHHVSTSVVNTDNIPFDFNNPKFAKAAVKLIEVVLETWMITADDFRRFLGEAISFQVARSVAPAVTVVDFLRGHTDGNVKRIKSTLIPLLTKQVIEGDYAPLLKYLDDYEKETIEDAELIDAIRDIFNQKSDLEKYESVAGAIKRLFEIFTLDEPDSAGSTGSTMALDQEVIVVMLETRGMDEIAEYIKQQRPSPETPITLSDFKKLYNSVLPIE